MAAPAQGLIDHPDHDLGGAVLQSWDAFIALVDGADLSRRTRLDGWTVREVVLHLGTWDGTSSLDTALATRGTDAARTPLDPDEANAALITAHRDASDEDVVAALRASRDAVADVLRDTIGSSGGRDVVASQLGPLPLLTLVHAGCYELAVHALDVADALDTTVDPVLLNHGIAALTDSTGCLAAREGIDAAIGINAESSPWSFTAHADGSWTTQEIVGKAHGPRVTGSAEDILEASAGRADPVRLVTLRHLKIKHVGGLLALTPIIDQVPGLPGGRGLKAAAKSLGGLFHH